MFETKELRLKTQCGFRKERSTMENLTGLEHYIWDGFNKTKPLNTYAIFQDIAKAFKTTWIQGLLYKLSTKGVNGNITGWLNNFLRNQTYNVRIGNTLSDDRPLKVGVPQGSPLSPFLFSVMIDDFPTLKSPGETFMFTDDMESHIHSSDGHQPEELLTPRLDVVSKWSKKWRIKFSLEKSTLINFSRQRRPQIEPLIFLNGKIIPQENGVKHLGIYFEKGLRWIKETEVAISKAINIQNLFKGLSRTKHGPSIDSLCILYKALVRSRLEYRLTICGSSSEGRKDKLEAVQNNILRIIQGAPKSTTVKEMQFELDILPLENRRTWLATRYIFRIENNKTTLYTPDAGS